MKEARNQLYTDSFSDYDQISTAPEDWLKTIFILPCDDQKIVKHAFL